MSKVFVSYVAGSAKDEAAVQALARFLRKEGYRHVASRDAAEVRDLVAQGRPDCVLVDLQVAGRSGLEILEAVRKKSPPVPVLVLTASVPGESLRRVLEFGHCDYVRKPFEIFELKHRVQSLLQAHARVERENPSHRASPAPQPAIQPLLPELHDDESGRIDAQKVAVYLGIPLKELARALGKKYAAAYKTPDAPSIQEGLRPIKRSLEILSQFLEERSTILAWLNSQHPDLGMRTPIDLIIEGRAEAVETLLENALAGVPT